jgi:hypothetical protein
VPLQTAIASRSDSVGSAGLSESATVFTASVARSRRASRVSTPGRRAEARRSGAMAGRRVGGTPGNT